MTEQVKAIGEENERTISTQIKLVEEFWGVIGNKGKKLLLVRDLQDNSIMNLEAIL